MENSCHSNANKAPKPASNFKERSKQDCMEQQQQMTISTKQNASKS
jgi:hypothetical protein